MWFFSLIPDTSWAHCTIFDNLMIKTLNSLKKKKTEHLYISLIRSRYWSLTCRNTCHFPTHLDLGGISKNFSLQPDWQSILGTKRNLIQAIILTCTFQVLASLRGWQVIVYRRMNLWLKYLWVKDKKEQFIQHGSWYDELHKITICNEYRCIISAFGILNLSFDGAI